MFYAPDVYLRENFAFSSAVISVDQSPQGRLKALKDGPYGRCVFKCDNDVVDHQVVNLQFTNDVTVNMSMCAFTDEFNRTMKLMVTQGQIRANLHKSEIELVDFRTGRKDVICHEGFQDKHAGADFRLMQDFVRTINGNGQGLTRVTEDTVRSHLMAMAAEKARVENTVVAVDQFAADVRKNMK